MRKRVGRYTLRQPKVRQLHRIQPSGLVQKDVLCARAATSAARPRPCRSYAARTRLDIAMDNPVRVQVRDGLQKGAHDRARVALHESAVVVRDPIEHGAPPRQLHHQVHFLVGFERSVVLCGAAHAWAAEGASRVRPLDARMMCGCRSECRIRDSFCRALRSSAPMRRLFRIFTANSAPAGARPARQSGEAPAPRAGRPHLGRRRASPPHTPPQTRPHPAVSRHCTDPRTSPLLRRHRRTWLRQWPNMHVPARCAAVDEPLPQLQAAAGVPRGLVAGFRCREWRKDETCSPWSRLRTPCRA